MLIYTMAPPALAADGSGSVYVAWTDARNGDWDVLVARSENGIQWTSPQRLNDDRVGNRRHQYLPRLATAPNGRLDAIFYDRRRDARNRENDVFYTFSLDRGRTFVANIRLSRQSSDSRIGQRYLVPSAKGKAEMGSRLGLLSDNASMLGAWTDTRNSKPPDSRGQDIYVGKLTVDKTFR